jgi:hypothetical protein
MKKQKAILLTICALLTYCAVQAQTAKKTLGSTTLVNPNCICKNAAMRFCRINSIPGNGMHNYRLLIEVNTERLSCKDFALTQLMVNGYTFKLSECAFLGTELASDGSFRMFQYDVKMPSLPAGTAVGTNFKGKMVFNIKGSCPYMYNFTYYGPVE